MTLNQNGLGCKTTQHPTLTASHFNTSSLHSSPCPFSCSVYTCHSYNKVHRAKHHIHAFTAASALSLHYLISQGTLKLNSNFTVQFLTPLSSCCAEICVPSSQAEYSLQCTRCSALTEAKAFAVTDKQYVPSRPAGSPLSDRDRLVREGFHFLMQVKWQSLASLQRIYLSFVHSLTYHAFPGK